MHIAWSLAVAALWALSSIMTKVAVANDSPDSRSMSAMTTSLLMYSGALGSLLLYVLLFDRAHIPVIAGDLRGCSGALIASIVATGVLSSFVANLLFGNLMRHHPVSAVSAIAYVAPVMVAAFAFTVLSEKCANPGWVAAGIGLTVVGVVTVTLAT